MVAEPESPLTRKILAQTAFDPVRQDSIDARSDPERFLEVLPLNYRSPYLWAAVAPDAEDDDDEDGPPDEVTTPLLFPGQNQDGSP